MEKINFVCGGRTGDFLHNLMAVKSICESLNKKASLYITNVKSYGGDTFYFDLHKTYNDLEPLVMSQSYIDSFNILKEEDKLDNYINLNDWRRSRFFVKKNWIDILCDLHSIEPPKEPWIKANVLEDYSNKILIHRSEHRQTPNFPWEKIVSENECFFITNVSTQQEYERFPYKDKVKLITCNSFIEMVEIINSCKFFIGNMSTPLALAHSLGKPHLGELIIPDQVHYIGDEKYLKDYFYISYFSTNHLLGIEKFIKL